MKRPRGTIWIFDFDGTVSHLVPDRQAAVLDPECKDLLTDIANEPDQVVAVASSRSLEDLKPRVPIENVVLAGGSGLEWYLPGGQWLGPNRQAAARLAASRQRVLPSLQSIRQIPGVEIEDKTWSAAVHFRKVADDDRILVTRELENLHVGHGITLHYGPSVAEIQFLSEVSKEIAVETLVSLFGRRFTEFELIYAGDDQNDAQAMRLVLERNGIVYVVGERIVVKGANAVADPTALARALRHRFMPALEH